MTGCLRPTHWGAFTGKKQLRHWFHETVRPPDDPRLCAYCDGEFDTSLETVDHFLPKSRYADLSLRWWNLFPACSKCQSYKKDERPDNALSPEWDIEALFHFDPLTGKLGPCPGLPERIEDRVVASIALFGLNDPFRCKARQRVFKGLTSYFLAHDPEFDALGRDGPYRFIAEQMRPLYAPALASWAR